MFYYSRDRKGEHPQRHLARYPGILLADAYDGYNQLYLVGRQPGPIRTRCITATTVLGAQVHDAHCTPEAQEHFKVVTRGTLLTCVVMPLERTVLMPASNFGRSSSSR
ncbi:hypothetical protein ACVILL_001009 [Bradyrhizobium sp. USDA 3364]